MTPEAFLQQVAWPKVQPSFVVGKGGGVMVLGGLLLLLVVGFGVCVGKYVVGFDGGKEGIVMFSVDGGVMLRML